MDKAARSIQVRTLNQTFHKLLMRNVVLHQLKQSLKSIFIRNVFLKIFNLISDFKCQTEEFKIRVLITKLSNCSKEFIKMKGLCLVA